MRGSKSGQTNWVRGAIVVAMIAIVGALAAAELFPRDPYVDITNDYPEPPPHALRVLFVGNSHLFVHEVPHIVQRLTPTSGRPLAFDALLSPGKTLEWHVAEGDVNAHAATTPYDAVILQPQSTQLVTRPHQTRASAEILSSYAPRARTILLQTWPRHPERDDFARQFGKTPEQWNELTASNAASDHWEVAPVGTAWICVHTATDVDLWHTDGNHASLAGAYVTALVLHRAIHGPDSHWTDYRPPGLAADVAMTLQTATDQCLRDDEHQSGAKQKL